MSEKRVCVAFGTRPEAYKMGPVVLALREQPGIEPVLLVTGQHREQLLDSLALFDLVPDADLAVMTERQSLPELLARIVPAAARELKRMEADYVLVHGDTLTTFAVALAAFYERIPVAHVEAGLRSFDLAQPFPEEANRRLTDVLTDLDLPPTPWAMENLLREGRPRETMFVTGNTVVDAVEFARARSKAPAWLPSGPLVTLTMHRRENLPVMRELAAALARVARQFDTFSFVYPMHLNPAVREAVEPELAGIPNVLLCEPLGYLEMLGLLNASELIVTDSGGIQEEGTALGKPVVVLRNVTERPEGLEAGSLRLAGNDPARVYETVARLLEDGRERAAMRPSHNPYGDGQAGRRIAAAVAWRLGLADRPEEWMPGTPEAAGQA